MDYETEIADLVAEAEELHKGGQGGHSLLEGDYVRRGHILLQLNANYNMLLAVAKHLKIPETDSRIAEAQKLYESANEPNYVRFPQLLDQANANYELLLAIFEYSQH